MPRNRTFIGDYAYPARIRRRGAKSTKEQWFAEPAPFIMPILDEAEAPLAISCRETLNNGPSYQEVYRRGPGGYLTHAGSVEALDTVLEGRAPVHAPARWDLFPAMRAIPRGNDDDHLDLRAAVIDDRRAEYLARATDAASRSAIIGDALWRACEPPMLVVAAYWYMDPYVTVRYVPGDRIPNGGMPFHVEDVPAAMGYAGWLSAHPWLHRQGAEIQPPPEGAVLTMPPDRRSFALSAARHVLGRLAASEIAPDFSAVPVSLLDAWVRFRKAEALVADGDVLAIAPAYEALADLHDRLPDLDPERAREPLASADVLRKTLEAPVRHWRLYLAGLVRSVADEADLATLATPAP